MPETRKPAPAKAAPKLPGAPKGNINNVRHGLTAANLPKTCRYIYHRVNNLRRQLEGQILEARGNVTMTDAAAVNTILRWEKAAQLWERAYRLWPDKYPDASDKAAKASAERDKAIARLRLDQDSKQTVLDALYSKALPAPTGNGDESA